MTYGDYTKPAVRDHAAKQGTRQRALDLVRDRSNLLWDESQGQLRYDWMELAGHKAPTLRYLLDEAALGKSRFIGVDFNETVITGCQQEYTDVPQAQWVQAPMESVLGARQYESLRDRVGVLVYDSHTAMHRKRLGDVEVALRFAATQFQRLREFMLVLNVVVDPRARKKSRYYTRYLNMVSEIYGTPIPRSALHVYTSKSVPMAWLALSYGF